MDKQVKKIADSLDMQRISHRRPIINKQTLISDLKQLARRPDVRGFPRRK